MPPEDSDQLIAAQIPEAVIARSATLQQLRRHRVEDTIRVPTPDRPTAPVSVTARHLYVEAETGDALLRIYHSSQVNPAGWAGNGRIDFGAWETIDNSADNLGSYEQATDAPHEGAMVRVLFSPSVPGRIYLFSFSANVHADLPFSFTVSSSSGAEQTYNFADPAELRARGIVVSVKVQEFAWYDLKLRLNQGYAWSFNECRISKTTTPS